MMELIDVVSAAHTAIDGMLDLVIEADVGSGPETLPFTYAPNDPYGLGPSVGAFFEANPSFPISAYEPPTPSTDPTDYPLSDRQLRLGLVMNGIGLAVIDAAIAGIANPLEKATAAIWWDRSTTIHWDHPMTQSLMGLVGITEQQASAMWLQAKDLAA